MGEMDAKELWAKLMTKCDIPGYTGTQYNWLGEHILNLNKELKGKKMPMDYWYGKFKELYLVKDCLEEQEEEKKE